MSTDEESEPAGAAGQVTLRFDTMRELIARLAPWLGSDGVFVASDSPLTEGTRVDFELKVRDQLKLLHGRAEVAWVRRLPGRGGEPLGMALRFLEVDPAGRRFVERLVENHRRGGGVPFDVESAKPAESRLVELTEVVPPRVRQDEGATEGPPREPDAAPSEPLAGAEAEPPASEAPVFEARPGARQEAFPTSFLDEVEAEIRSAPPLEDEPGPVPPDAGPASGEEELTLEVELPEEELEEWPVEAAAAPAEAPPDSREADLREEVPRDEPEAAEEEPLESGEPEVAEQPEAERPGIEEPPEAPEPAEPPPPPPRHRDLLSLPDLPPVAPVIDRTPPREPSPPLRAEIFEPPSEAAPVVAPDITPGAQYAEPRGARRTWAVLLFSLLTVGVLAALFLLGDRLLQIWRQGAVEPVATPAVEKPAEPLERRPRVTRPKAGAPEPTETAPEPAPAPPEEEGAAARVGPEAAAAEAGGAQPPAEPPPGDEEPSAGDPPTRIESIEWVARGGRTVVTVQADHPIRPRHVAVFRLDGDNPRQVVKIAGIRQPLSRPMRTVGTPQITRIRSGLHELPEGNELHLVFDLTGRTVQLERQAPAQGRLQLVFTGGATP